MCKQLDLQRTCIKDANILQILNSDMGKHVVQCHLKKKKGGGEKTQLSQNLNRRH